MFLMDVAPLETPWVSALVQPQTAAAAAAAAAPIAPPPALTFLKKGDIKGVDVSPPVDNWTAAQYGMTPTRIAALKAAGFNTLRVWLPIAEFLRPPVSMGASVTKWTRYIQRANAAGFRVFVAWGASWDDRIAVVNNTPVRYQWGRTLNAVCASLSQNFAVGDVALEMINEPPDESLTPNYYAWAAPLQYGACRKYAPKLTIIFQPENGWYQGMNKFRLSDYDQNVMFSFHPYSPGEFTHQGIGNQPYLWGVPMPITRYQGGPDKMVADVTRRINADSTLSDDVKRSEIARYTGFIYYFLWVNDGSDWQKWKELTDWVTKTGINPKRIIAGEFGMVSEWNYNGRKAMPDVATRANWMRGIRKQVEAYNYGGWVVHQALGDFNLFAEWGVGAQGDTLIPELVQALFGNDPLPAAKMYAPTD